MRTLALALLLAPAASAGVIVVDAAGGPGADFTSLSAAIAAAADGDVLLLRAGTYDGDHVVSGKALSLIADDGALVQVKNSLTGNPSASALRVGSDVDGSIVLRGLTLSTPQGGGVPLVVSGAAVPDGRVYIEECHVPTSGQEGMRLGNVSAAIVSQCNVNGSQPDATPGPFGFPLAAGRPGLVVGAGPLAVFAGFLTGGEGLKAGLYGPLPLPTVGADGSPGVRIDDASGALKLFAGSICIGGIGGAGANPGQCLKPGDGGDGILSVNGGNAHVIGIGGTGNLPGAPAGGCAEKANAGVLLDNIAPGQAPTWLPGNPVSSTMPRVRREGQTATVTVFNASNSNVLLVVGFELQFAYMPAHHGALVVVPALVVDLGAVPFTGSVSVHMTVPELGPGVESVIAHVQPFAKDWQGHRSLGAPSTILMVDSQF